MGAQSKLVGILLDAADAHPNVTVRFGHRVTAVVQQPPAGTAGTAETVAIDWSAAAMAAATPLKAAPRLAVARKERFTPATLLLRMVLQALFAKLSVFLLMAGSRCST